MNILLDALPNEVEIEGQSYQIKTNFREWIRFEITLNNQNLSNEEKILMALELFIKKPINIEKAIEELLKFYNCNEESMSEQNNNVPSLSKKTISYEADQYIIYTDFMHYYHIDLNKTIDLHWWQFKQLLYELPEESKMKKVMLYRSIRIDSKMNKEQRNFYLRMKKLYSLKEDNQNQVNTVASILARGMSI